MGSLKRSELRDFLAYKGGHGGRTSILTNKRDENGWAVRIRSRSKAMRAAVFVFALPLDNLVTAIYENDFRVSAFGPLEYREVASKRGPESFTRRLSV